MPWRSQIRMIRWVRAAVRSCARPGSAGEIHSSRPAGSVTTCTFTPLASVFLGEVGPAAADTVALREGAVEQYVVGVGFAKEPGCRVGEQVDDGCHAGVGGVDGNAEAGRELGEGVVPPQVQADEGTLVRSNRLTRLPDWVVDMPALEKLDVRWNACEPSPSLLTELERRGCVVLL